MPQPYDQEYKLEAVRIAAESDVTAKEVENLLGIGQGVLSRWKQQFSHDGQQAFAGKGHLKSEDNELRRLNREIDRLRRERDILKKRWPSSQRTCIGIRVHERAPH